MNHDLQDDRVSELIGVMLCLGFIAAVGTVAVMIALFVVHSLVVWASAFD